MTPILLFFLGIELLRHDILFPKSGCNFTYPTCVLSSPARFVSFDGVIREVIIIVTAIHHCTNAPLFHVAGAVGLDGGLLGFCQSGQQQGGENGNDCDHDQQFDQRKTVSVKFGFHKIF